MVRTPLRALPAADEGRIADHDDPTVLADLDPLLAEAVAVASPSLAAALDKALVEGAQQLVPSKDVKRLASALARYRIRMATRSTPFGLFAGVGVGEFGSAAHGRMG